MAAGPWVVYDKFKLALGNKLVDLDSDTIKVALFTSSSNAGSAALATATYAALTNQVANGNGYTTGGVTVASTYLNAGGTLTFDIADPSWTAAGGAITARFAVIYSDTAASKDLIAYCLLDSTPADVSVTAGNTLAIEIAAGGVFTLA